MKKKPLPFMKVSKAKKTAVGLILAGGMLLGMGGTAFAAYTASAGHPNANAACFGQDEGTGVGDASVQQNNHLGVAIGSVAKNTGGVGWAVALYQADCPR